MIPCRPEVAVPHRVEFAEAARSLSRRALCFMVMTSAIAVALPAQVINYGGNVNRTIVTGEVASYALSGLQGERVVLLATRSCCGSAFSPCVDIRLGATVVGSACASGPQNRLDVQLPADGTYTVRVWDNPSRPSGGRFNLAVQRVFPAPSPNATPLGFPQSLSVSLANEGEVKSFAVQARSGATFALGATLACCGSSFDPCIELWNPLGQRVAVACSTAPTNTLSYTTTMAGTFVVLLYDNASLVSGGRAILSLTCSSTSCTTSASFVTFGAACLGSAGLPVLDRQSATSLPVVGSTFTLDLTSIVPPTPFSVPVLMLGTSNSTWSGMTLPISLTPLGAFGCFLHVGPEALLIASFQPGSPVPVWQLPIPLNRALVGVTLHAQALAVDSINSLGLVFSNGISMTIG